MRIWILSTELPSEVTGGIARYLNNWGRLLSSAGHEIMVIARSNDAHEEQIGPGFRVMGVEARIKYLNDDFDPTEEPAEEPDTHPAYPFNILSDAMAFSYQMAEEVINLLKQTPSPDIIESQEYNALPYYLIQKKLTEHTILEKIPILVHTHSPYFELSRVNQEPRYRFPGYWVGQMEKFCIQAADALLSPSNFLAQSLKQTLQLSSAINIVPYPALLDTNIAPNASVQPGHIIYVGPLEVRKGILKMLKICQRLWSAGHDFHLTLIGEDSYFMPMDTTVSAFMEKRYARWIESGHIRWLGQLDHAEAMEHIRQAWAVVIPSLWDNFPDTCIEAMGMGQVVLGSNSGGQAEMIKDNGINGFLFDWNIPGDFEQKIIQVINLDPRDRLSLGRKAQERIRTLCDPGEVLSQRLKLYQDIIENYKPKSLFPRTNNEPSSSLGKKKPATSRTARSKDEQPDLLSVIIPYYNLGEYVNETLASVLASIYSPLEVVIINDGSTEAKSIEVLKEIEGRGLRNLRIIHTDNQGVAVARKIGTENAQGEFLAFLDPDDLVEPDFYQRALDVLKRYPNVTFVYSWVRYFGAYRQIYPSWNVEFPYLLGYSMVPSPTVIRRVSFLMSGQKEEMYNLEDYEGWISILKAGGIGVCLPLPLVRYRVRSDSRIDLLRTNRGINQNLYLFYLVTQYHRELYGEWGAELFNLLCANGPGWHWYPARSFTVYERQQEIIEQHWEENQKLGEENQKLWEENQKLWEEVQKWHQHYEDIANSRQWRIYQRLRHSAPGRLAANIVKRLGYQS